MKLITEEVHDIQFLTENTKTGDKKMYITGIFSEADVVNGNKRRYPMKTLLPEIKRYNEEYVAKNRAIGQLNHPDGPTISLNEVSHRITSLEQKGNQFIGKALVLDTPSGNIVKGLVNGGVSIGVSSRALGSVTTTNEGYSIVQPDLKLICWDIVSTPSCSSAWMNGIMEQAEWLYNASTDSWILAEQFRTQYSKMKQSKINEVKLNDFQLFLNSLK